MNKTDLNENNLNAMLFAIKNSPKNVEKKPYKKRKIGIYAYVCEKCQHYEPMGYFNPPELKKTKKESINCSEIHCPKCNNLGMKAGMVFT